MDDLPGDPAGPRARSIPLLSPHRGPFADPEDRALSVHDDSFTPAPQRRPHVAILGAGPIGLEAALAAADAGLPFTVYEAGRAAAANVRAWGHVRLFTPWDLNVSPRMRRHLGAAGGGVPVPAGDGCPTGLELAELCARVAALPAIAPHLRLGTRVLAVGRQGLLKHEEIASAERGRRPFRLLIAAAGAVTDAADTAGSGGAAGAAGGGVAARREPAAAAVPGGERAAARDGGGGAAATGERIELAGVVIDASGTWGHPNWLGDGGIPAAGERQLDGEIRRSIPDLAREAADWAGRTVLVAGGGASAQTAVRDLAELAAGAPGTRIIWALRRGEPSWNGSLADPLPERARLTAAARRLAGGASPAVTVERGVVVEAVERAGAPAGSGRLLVSLRDCRAGAAPAAGAAGADGPHGTAGAAGETSTAGPAGRVVTDGAADAAGAARAAAGRAAADQAAVGRAGGAGGTRQVVVDRVLSLTGAVGDHQLYRQLQVHECYATCGPMKLSAALLGAAGGDCLDQTAHGVETLTSPEPGFYILGSKSYGRNNTFLLRVGWEQVAEVFAALRGAG